MIYIYTRMPDAFAITFCDAYRWFDKHYKYRCNDVKLILKFKFNSFTVIIKVNILVSP